MTIEEKYKQLCSVPSDINELLPVLVQFIPPNAHITEFGTRHCVSAYAFLWASPRKFVTYDICRYPEVDELIANGLVANIPMEFHQANVLEIDIESTDILFIDTFHVAEQCRQELERHAGKVSGWIVFHDTTTFWEQGEEPYEGIAYTLEASRQGLKYAIEPFLAAHPEWVEVYRTHINNGLLILQRQTHGQ